jgi:hypothetical protein
VIETLETPGSVGWISHELRNANLKGRKERGWTLCGKHLAALAKIIFGADPADVTVAVAPWLKRNFTDVDNPGALLVKHLPARIADAKAEREKKVRAAEEAKAIYAKYGIRTDDGERTGFGSGIVRAVVPGR